MLDIMTLWTKYVLVIPLYLPHTPKSTVSLCTFPYPNLSHLSYPTCPLSNSSSFLIIYYLLSIFYFIYIIIMLYNVLYIITSSPF